MTTIAQTITPIKRATHSGHRKAFGPGKYRTAAEKARDVAASIAQRHDEGRAWSWSTYGLDGDAAEGQRRLVEAALTQLTYTAEEEERLQQHYWEQEMARLEDWERMQDLEVHGRW
jgi:hypothetical protein